MWRSEDYLQESIIFFYQEGPRDQTRAVRLGTKHLYLLDHLWCGRIVSQPQVVFAHGSWLTISSLKQAIEARTPLTQHGSENPNLFQTFCSRVHHKQILFMEPAIRTELNEKKPSWC